MGSGDVVFGGALVVVGVVVVVVVVVVDGIVVVVVVITEEDPRKNKQHTLKNNLSLKHEKNDFTGYSVNSPVQNPQNLRQFSLRKPWKAEFPHTSWP